MATHLGDTRSLALPAAHTIYYEMGAERRKQMGIADSLIRVSVGIEDEADLLSFHAARSGGYPGQAGRRRLGGRQGHGGLPVGRGQAQPPVARAAPACTRTGQPDPAATGGQQPVHVGRVAAQDIPAAIQPL
ncbi:hypothetical protein G6F31_017427 [Rhizopus arrhizus]|nr:hypothetical protein G6F24_015664 [Rhizopus arrhizus]KAG0929233.1 hypothetical protein G6F31_017427 [Rhizopus arrhizus]